MMNTETKFKTEQEAFWAGSFGTEYIQRMLWMYAIWRPGISYICA